MLSLGEQQRVAWLRLLLHAPGLAFLDEVRVHGGNPLDPTASFGFENQIWMLNAHRKARPSDTLDTLLSVIASMAQYQFRRSCENLPSAWQATGALDADTEAALYRTLQGRVGTVVSVGARWLGDAHEWPSTPWSKPRAEQKWMATAC